MDKNWKVVGKIKEAHGIQGDWYVLIFSKDVQWIDDVKKFMTESPSGERQEWEIQKIRPNKDGVVLKGKGIVDRTQAEKYKGYKFLLAEDVFISEPGEDIYLAELLDFEVFDRQVSIGKVKSFSTNVAQDLLVVQDDQGGFEVPLVEDFIEEIDFENKKIFLELPEGLIEINRT